MAKLSHSGHTQIPDPLKEWPEDWPELEVIMNFWFFGLRNQRLLPTPDNLKDHDSLLQWATSLNLIDESGIVPEWLHFVASYPERVNALFEEGIEGRVHTLNLPSSSSLRLLPIAPVPLKLNRQQVGSTRNPYTASDIPLHLLPPKLRSGMEGLLRDSESLLLKELHFDPARETRAKAMLRITQAFQAWLRIQLHWIDCATLDRTDRNISSKDLKNFIRFQCERVPLRRIVPKLNSDDDLSSKQSATRKMLKRVAERLQLQLRVERSGRPPKKKTMEFD